MTVRDLCPGVYAWGFTSGAFALEGIDSVGGGGGYHDRVAYVWGCFGLGCICQGVSSFFCPYAWGFLSLGGLRSEGLMSDADIRSQYMPKHLKSLYTAAFPISFWPCLYIEKFCVMSRNENL